MFDEKDFVKVIVVSLLLSLVLSSFWGVFAPKIPSINMQLNSYDTVVESGEELCFDVFLHAVNHDKGANRVFRVRANNELIFEDPVVVTEAGESISKCFNLSGFSSPIFMSLELEGKDPLDTDIQFQRLFYNASYVASLDSSSSLVEVSSFESGVLNFKVENNSDKSGVYPLVVKVNDIVDHTVLAKLTKGELVSFSEKVDLPAGNNVVSVTFKGLTASTSVSKESDFTLPGFVGFPIVLLLGLLPGYFFFRHKNLIDSTALTLALMAVLFIAVPFLLNYTGLISRASVILTLGLISLLAFVLNKNAKFGVRKVPKEVLVFAAGLILVSSVLMIFVPEHFNLWNVFYERYANIMKDTVGIPVLDDLSYLGRGYTFVQGYFLFNSSLHWVSGLSDKLLFALTVSLINLFFGFSVLYLTKSFGFNLRKSLLLFLFLISSLFIFVTFIMSPKHILAMSLFLTGVGLLNNKKPISAGIIGGVAAFTQAFSAFAFTLLYFALSKKVNAGNYGKSLFVGGLVFLALFAPTLIQFGNPYQVDSENWGYRITGEAIQIVGDLGSFVGALLVFGILYHLAFWKKLNSYHKKLLGVAVGLFLVEIFLTYRVNILLIAIAGVFFIDKFEKRLGVKKFLKIVGVLVAITLFLNFQAVQFNSAGSSLLSASSFLKDFTSTESNVLSDPLYGHAITFFGDRKVLADLYVEYADAQKLDDAYSFLLSKDAFILDDYDIDFVLVNNKFIMVGAGETISYDTSEEFINLDKVSFSGDFDVYLVRQ